MYSLRQDTLCCWNKHIHPKINQAKAYLLPTTQTNLYWKDLLGDFHKLWLRVLPSWNTDIFKTHGLSGPRGSENQDETHQLLIASAWKSHKWPLLPMHWPELSLIAESWKMQSSWCPEKRKWTQITVSAMRGMGFGVKQLRNWFWWHFGHVA